MESFGQMWTFLGKWPFFRADMAGLGHFVRRTGGISDIDFQEINTL